MQASFDDASLSYAMSAVAVIRDTYNAAYDLPVPLSRFFVEATAIDPDALHVSATDLALISRGSLANLDPFVVADISVREAIIGGHCGCRLSLALAGDRVREWADAD